MLNYLLNKQEAHPTDPFNEEKGEVRTGNSSHSTSTVTTPEAEVAEVAETSHHDIDLLDFSLLVDGNCPEASPLSLLRRYVIDHQLLVGPLNLDEDHPLEEVSLPSQLQLNHSISIL